MMNAIERQLLEAARSQLPEDLRARVLAATAPLIRRDDSRLDRIWFSRTWRVAAVVALVALVGIDVLVRPAAPSAVPPGRPAVETALAVEAAARDAGLTPAQASALGARALAAARQARVPDVAPDALLERWTR